MAAFEYRQAEEVRDVFARHGVRYLFIGKSGAILLGFPDTTQDAHLFVEKSPANGAALVTALRQLGFTLTEPQADEIRRGKDFIQLKNGPFDLVSSSPRTASNDSSMRGGGAWRSKGFLSVIWTTSSPAKPPPTARKIASRYRGCARSANTGCVSVPRKRVSATPFRCKSLP